MRHVITFVPTADIVLALADSPKLRESGRGIWLLASGDDASYLIFKEGQEYLAWFYDEEDKEVGLEDHLWRKDGEVWEDVTGGLEIEDFQEFLKFEEPLVTISSQEVEERTVKRPRPS